MRFRWEHDVARGGWPRNAALSPAQAFEETVHRRDRGGPASPARCGTGTTSPRSWPSWSSRPSGTADPPGSPDSIALHELHCRPNVSSDGKMHALLVLGGLGGCRSAGASWRVWRDLDARLVLIGRRLARHSVRGARGVAIGRAWVCRALRARTGVAGWDNYRGGGRFARCSSCLPDLRTSTPGEERGNYPVVTPLPRIGTTG